MGYEIPQQLKYEEKIIFGLTARQLGYASLTILPALLIFTNSHIGIIPKIIFCTLLVCLGCLFMFFDFFSSIRNFLLWSSFRSVSIGDRKMMDFLGLDRIDGGVLYVRKAKMAISKK